MTLKKTAQPFSFSFHLGYYGILQGAHLLSLVRAGYLYLTWGSIPFPAPPPDPGWHAQVVPFLLAMGAVDGSAALIGLLTAYQYFVRGNLLLKPLLVSLLIAVTSAGVFTVGTIFSGAWAAHPLQYLLLVVLFSPLFPLLYGVYQAVNAPPE